MKKIKKLSLIKVSNQPEGIYKNDLNLYQNHYLEQYKIYSDRVDMDLQRLLTREKFFLTINSTFIAGLVLARDKISSIGKETIISVTILAIILSLIWFFTMYHANKLKSAQLHVLRSMEKNLPAKPFLCERYKTPWNNIKVLKLGCLRNSIPVLFGVLYVIYLIVIISK